MPLICLKLNIFSFKFVRNSLEELDNFNKYSLKALGQIWRSVIAMSTYKIKIFLTYFRTYPVTAQWVLKILNFWGEISWSDGSWLASWSSWKEIASILSSQRANQIFPFIDISRIFLDFHELVAAIWSSFHKFWNVFWRVQILEILELFSDFLYRYSINFYKTWWDL